MNSSNKHSTKFGLQSPNPNALVPLIVAVVGVALIIGAVILFSQPRQAPLPTEDSLPIFQTDPSAPSPSVPRIKVEDAKKAFDSSSAIFVDTRSVELYNERHITGSIDISSTEAALRYQELDPQKWIILYCT